MFDKLKQMNELKKMQAELGQESITVNSNQYGDKLTITITGQQNIQNIHIAEELKPENLEQPLIDLINKAIKESQMLMMKKIQAGNFNLPPM